MKEKETTAERLWERAEVITLCEHYRTLALSVMCDEMYPHCIFFDADNFWVSFRVSFFAAVSCFSFSSPRRHRRMSHVMLCSHVTFAVAVLTVTRQSSSLALSPLPSPSPSLVKCAPCCDPFTLLTATAAFAGFVVLSS